MSADGWGCFHHHEVHLPAKSWSLVDLRHRLGQNIGCLIGFAPCAPRDPSDPLRKPKKFYQPGIPSPLHRTVGSDQPLPKRGPDLDQFRLPKPYLCRGCPQALQQELAMTFLSSCIFVSSLVHRVMLLSP